MCKAVVPEDEDVDLYPGVVDAEVDTRLRKVARKNFLLYCWSCFISAWFGDPDLDSGVVDAERDRNICVKYGLS